MFSNSTVMTSNGLEQQQRLSLQVYESHIYVYDEINLYEQLILHYYLSLYRKKVKFWGVFDGFRYKNATMEGICGNYVSSLKRSMYCVLIWLSCVRCSASKKNSPKGKNCTFFRKTSLYLQHKGNNRNYAKDRISPDHHREFPGVSFG